MARLLLASVALWAAVAWPSVAGKVLSERELTVEVQPGRVQCFFESVMAGSTIDIDYQVIDGGAENDMTIDFQLVPPSGTGHIVADFRKSENTHRYTVDSTKVGESGDYQICFDNSQNRFSPKVVFFEVVIEDEEEEENSFGQIFVGVTEKESYDVKVQDIEDVLINLRERLTRSRHFQDQIRTHEFRDRSIAEHNFERVNFWSFVHVGIMLIAGVTQVIVVRSLFDEKSSLHGLWRRIC